VGTNEKKVYCKPEIVELSSNVTYGNGTKSMANMEEGMSGMGVS
jgi:hypothetical protein